MANCNRRDAVMLAKAGSSAAGAHQLHTKVSAGPQQWAFEFPRGDITCRDARRLN